MEINNYNPHTDETNDLTRVYGQLLSCFAQMYPDKKINMNETEYNSYVNLFCKLIGNESKYFNPFLNKDPRVFKGLKFSFIKGIKMEVILSSNKDTNEKLVNEMWNTMHMLYLLGEANKSNPNTQNMQRIALKMDISKGALIETTNDENKMPELFNAFKDINMNEIENMVSNLGISKDQFESIKSGVGLDLNDAKIKNLLSEIGKPPTEGSHRFMNDILNDVKTKFKLDENDGKVNAKLFVDQLLNVGNSIGDEYGKKIGTGELAVGDIVSAITSLASNPNGSSVISDITNTLKLDKLDMKEVIEEIKLRMDGKIPAELMALLSNFDPQNIQNLNIGEIIGTMMSGEGENIVELTTEQKNELMEYYSSLEI